MASPLPSNDFHAHTTSDLYSLWASTYDTDGNILQAIDDQQLLHLLPVLVDHIQTNSTSSSQTPPSPIRLLDLGCGTGRNTLKLLQQPWPFPVAIEGWDSSGEMLAIAREKCNAATINNIPTTTQTPTLKFTQTDLTSLPPSAQNPYAAIISTLVLEHIPLPLYFTALASLLAPGGLALVTNMHPDMGATTQAGFKDGATGRRLKGTSFSHGVAESVKAAEEAGLRVLGEVREVAVSEEMLRGFGVGVREGAGKWVGRRVWFAMVLGKGKGLE